MKYTVPVNVIYRHEVVVEACTAEDAREAAEEEVLNWSEELQILGTPEIEAEEI